MSPGLVYRSAAGYELLMRVLYGRHYAARMRSVADQVPGGASVLECCCGPGTLYLRHLPGRISAYVGIDVNARFVARLRRRGVDARRLDLAAEQVEIPHGALWKNTSTAFGVRWKYSGASASSSLTVICRGRSSTNRPTTQAQPVQGQALDSFGQHRIPGDQGAALDRRDVLGHVERERGEVAERADPTPAPPRPRWPTRRTSSPGSAPHRRGRSPVPASRG